MAANGSQHSGNSAGLETGRDDKSHENAATLDLINVLEAIELPVIVLKHDLTVSFFSQSAVEEFQLSRSDIGRKCRDVQPLAGLARLEQKCMQAVSGGADSRLDFRHRDKWFVVRICPTAKGNGEKGAVLTFANVTAFRASLDHAIYEREFTKALINTVATPFVVLDADLRVQSGNRAFYTIFATSSDETQGIPLYEIANGTLGLAPLRRSMMESFGANRPFQPFEVDLTLGPEQHRTLIVEAHKVAFPGYSEHRILVTFQDITARKLAETAKDLRSEEELRRSEAFLAEGQRLSLTGSFCWHIKNEEITCSEQFYRIFDFDHGTPVTLAMIRDRIHPEDKPQLERMVGSARSIGGDFDYECRLHMPDDSIKHLHVIAHGSAARDGRREYVGAVCDITARRWAEEEARRSEVAAEQQLRLVVDTAPVFITSARPDGYIDYFNKGLLDYLGLSLANIEGLNWLSCIHSDDAPSMLEKWKTILASGKAGEDHEARVRRFDGVYRWFLHRSAPMHDQEGRIVRWFGTAIDIEDRRNAEEALRRSEAFLTEAQRLSLTGSFSWRTNDNRIAWSEQLYRIFEIDQATPVTLDAIRSRVYPEDSGLFSAITHQLRSEARDWDFECRLQMPDHTTKYLHVIAHGIRGEHGSVEYIGAAQDVTQRQQAEANLATARSEVAMISRATSLGMLTASIAHEVNQPLTAVAYNGQACLRLLAGRSQESEILRSALDEIVTDALRASAIIARIRSFVMKTPTERNELDVNAVIHEVLELTGREIQKQRVLLECQLADIPAVVADRIQVQQVLLNLITNGLEAMTGIPDQHRALSIKTGVTDSREVLVLIRDSGTGLGPHADQIFAPFFTTKTTGMGMGLAISRSIIEDHGGRLWAEPNSPQGAIFSFTLPQVGGSAT